MRQLFTIFTALISLIATAAENDLLAPCDFSVDGESYYSDFLERTFACGNKIVLEKHTFDLPDEVDEMHCSAFKADFNADGRMDYILQVAGTGNGRNFGLCDIYIFVSCPADAKEGMTYGHLETGADGGIFRYMYITSYGIDAVKSDSRILLQGTTLSEDNRTFIEHYYSFDNDGWMKETAVRLQAPETAG